MTRRTTPLTWHHLLLILAVVAVWGTNFVIIKFALAHLPPLLLAALRFALAAFPLVLLVRRPAASWGNLALYGLAIGVGQFALLFYGMQRDITPGLASLVVQAQVFFTVGLAVLIDKERLRPYQWVAALIALTGIVIIASHTDGHTTLAGLLLTLGAAFFWALGNVASRAAGPVDVLAYVAWSSLFAVPPLLLLSWALEGWPRIASGLAQADAATWAAVVWQSLGNTIFGYGVWAWLLARYPASMVVRRPPRFTLFAFAALVRPHGAPPRLLMMLAAGLVMAGLALNLLWPRLVAAARG